MKSDISNVERGTDPGLLDDLVEAYVTWRERTTDVRDAYGRWNRHSGPRDAEAFHHYCAALDREEHAAAAYQVLIKRVQHHQRRASRDGRSGWWMDLAMALAVAGFGMGPCW